jgi:hypothetical protein
MLLPVTPSLGTRMSISIGNPPSRLVALHAKLWFTQLSQWGVELGVVLIISEMRESSDDRPWRGQPSFATEHKTMMK